MTNVVRAASRKGLVSSAFKLRAWCIAVSLAVWIVLIFAPGVRAELGGIAADSEGRVWFTEPTANELGRLSSRGAIARLRVPTAHGEPVAISIADDGSAWFTEHRANRIGRIGPGDAIHEYPVPVPPAAPLTPGVLGTEAIHSPGELPGPGSMVAGPDGNMWFTEGGDSFGVSGVYGGQIAKIAPNGVVTEYQIPSTNAEPRTITAGPDGNLWFTESTLHGGAVGRITPNGEIRIFALPESHEPGGIAPGRDGALWFTDVVFGRQRIVGMIGHITTSGEVSDFPLSTPEAQPDSITAGKEGDMWFTAFPPPKPGANGPPLAGPTSGRIGRITMGGRVTEFGSHHAALEITQGPDGDMWFTQIASNALGRIAPNGRLSEVPTKPRRAKRRARRAIPAAR